jgi:hypothetical protein
MARHAENMQAKEDRRKLGDRRNPVVSVLQNARGQSAYAVACLDRKTLLDLCVKAHLVSGE